MSIQRQGRGASMGSSKSNLLLVIVLVVLVAAGAYVAKSAFGSGYWAIYLRTGDIYFGKLQTCPRLSLSDAYLLQLTGDEENPFAVTRFDRSIWGPQDQIYLNPNNVVWKAKLAEDSQFLAFLKNPDAQIQQQQQQAQQQQQLQQQQLQQQQAAPPGPPPGLGGPGTEQQ